MGMEVIQPDLHTLFAPVAHENNIGLAVSGGADSLGLMLLVHQWGQLHDVDTKITVYSVDHQLRKESVDECRLVAELATELGFETRTLTWQGIKPETGVQAGARIARYQLISKAMERDGVQVLLTGHHKQDQSETILMRLAHSSGISGLAGIRDFSTVEGVKLFRPLLNISREQLKAMVVEAGYVPVHDPSNSHEKYERVRWRKILPQLETLGMNGDVLTRFALRMGRADTALSKIAQGIFIKSVTVDQFGVYSFPLALFKNQPDEIAIRIIECLVRCASGNNGGELSQFEKLHSEVLGLSFNGRVIAGCKLEIWRDNLVVFREAGKISGERVLLGAKEEIVWDQRFVLTNNGPDRVEIASAKSLTRSEFESFVKMNSSVKMSAVQAAPLIRDSEGKLILLGEISKTMEISSQLIFCKSKIT